MFTKDSVHEIDVEKVWLINDTMPHRLRVKGIRKYGVKDTKGNFFTMFGASQILNAGDRAQVRITQEGFDPRIAVMEKL